MLAPAAPRPCTAPSNPPHRSRCSLPATRSRAVSLAPHYLGMPKTGDHFSLRRFISESLQAPSFATQLYKDFTGGILSCNLNCAPGFGVAPPPNDTAFSSDQSCQCRPFYLNRNRTPDPLRPRLGAATAGLQGRPRADQRHDAERNSRRPLSALLRRRPDSYR